MSDQPESSCLVHLERLMVDQLREWSSAVKYRRLWDDPKRICAQLDAIADGIEAAIQSAPTAQSLVTGRAQAMADAFRDDDSNPPTPADHAAPCPAAVGCSPSVPNGGDSGHSPAPVMVGCDLEGIKARISHGYIEQSDNTLDRFQACEDDAAALLTVVADQAQRIEALEAENKRLDLGRTVFMESKFWEGKCLQNLRRAEGAESQVSSLTAALAAREQEVISLQVRLKDVEAMVAQVRLSAENWQRITRTAEGNKLSSQRLYQLRDCADEIRALLASKSLLAGPPAAPQETKP